MEFLNNPSIRRLIVTLMAPVFVYVNKKFGVEVSESLQQDIIFAVIAYVVSGNLKEAAIKRAQLQATNAKAQVKTVQQADKKIMEELR